MTRYLARRVLTSVGVALGVLVFTFSMLHLAPGDPVIAMLGRQAATPERIEALRGELGLDRPLPVQFADYLGGVLRGELGTSIQTRRPVADAIAEQLPSTLQLMLAAMLVAVTIGAVVGILSATRAGTRLDRTLTVGSLAAVSVPSFWLALLLILVFAVGLGWLPAAASSGELRGLVLPALALGIGEGAILARLIRANLVEQLAGPHIDAARARGLRERRVVGVYALRNAMLPVVTIIGLQFGYLLAGSVVIETIFARQGLGRLAVQAVSAQDFPLAQGIVLVMALTYVAINTLTDLTYVWLDPRVRL